MRVRVSSATCSPSVRTVPLAAGLVADIDRRVRAFGALDRAADAAERVEIIIDGGDAEFDRFEVLVGEIDVGEHVLQQLRLLHRRARAAVGEALAPRVGLGDFVFVSHLPFSIRLLTLEP